MRPDIAFLGSKVAVFVDGCFWHDCPTHRPYPRGNSSYWQQKLAHNVERDGIVTKALEDSGWRVLRVWEHQDLNEAVELVKAALNERSHH